MKIKLFLAHDPGGWDVTAPVVRRLREQGGAVEYWCVGPAGRLNPESNVLQEEVMLRLTRYLDEGRISMLVTGTSWGTDIEKRAVQLAQSRQIPTVSILDYWSNYSERMIINGTAVYPDHYVVMDDLARREAAADGVPEHCLVVLGQPGLDRFVRISETKRLSVDRVRKVLFLSQPLSVLYGDAWGYTEYSVMEDLIRIVGRLAANIKLQVKFHPKDEAALRAKYKDLVVDGDLMELLPQYDLIIGMNSMGLLHAVLLGVPTISYQPGLKKSDVCITTKLGLTPLITGLEDLLKALQDWASNGNLAYAAASREAYLWMDGRSTERVVRFLQEVVAGGQN